MSRKIDIDACAERVGSRYPAPFHESGMRKARKLLGDAAGLTQFGVNLLTLEPGVVSAQRHWHTATSSSSWSRARWCWSPTRARKC